MKDGDVLDVPDDLAAPAGIPGSDFSVGGEQPEAKKEPAPSESEG